jgi:hypothetical protein
LIEKEVITRESIIEMEAKIKDMEAEIATMGYILMRSGRRARAIDMLEAYNRKYLAPELTMINFPVLKRDVSFHPEDAAGDDSRKRRAGEEEDELLSMVDEHDPRDEHANWFGL